MITKKKHKSKPSYFFSNIWLNIIISTLAIIFIFTVFAISYFIKKDEQFKDKIYPNIYVNNINFGNRSKTDIIDYYETKNKALKAINISVLYQNNIEATLSGTILLLKYPAETAATQAFLVGRGEHLQSKLYQKISSILNWSSFNIIAGIEYDRHQIDQLLSDLEDKYNKPAKNALFKFEDERVINFRKEETGQAVNTKKFYENFASIINNLNTDIKDVNIVLDVSPIKPEVSLSQANNFGIEELIGEGVSDYTHSDQDRIYNLTLAASRMNGVLMPKDKIFSFNEAIGEISSLTGYKKGYVIKEGKTVLDDGGGVCQVSTTFFRAILNAGLPVVERRAHDYRVLYYENGSPPGFDATVYPPYVDIKVKNDTTAYILIQTEIDESTNLLTFRLYGKKDGRRSEISNYKMYDSTPPPEPLYQDAPNLKKGETKQIEIARYGLKTSFDYKVYKDDKVIYETNFFSNFKPWRAIYLVGTAD